MRVYFVRHGESQANLEKLWTGWWDVPLTDRGRAEAAAIRPIFSGVSFDQIYSSDLSRAIETAKTAIPDCEPEVMTILREVDVGDLVGKPIVTNTDDAAYINTQNGYAEFGGESRTEFRKRVLEFLHFLEQADAQTVAVFSHAGFLRAVFNHVLKCEATGKMLHLFNCCVLILDYNGTNWALHGVINQNG